MWYGSKHTREHKVVSLFYAEPFNSKIEALKIERQIKGWRREKKINLIKYGNNLNVMGDNKYIKLHKNFADRFYLWADIYGVTQLHFH